MIDIIDSLYICLATFHKLERFVQQKKTLLQNPRQQKPCLDISTRKHQLMAVGATCSVCLDPLLVDLQVK